MGYAVVDLETTGPHPGFDHRVAEIAVVQLDDAGVVEGEWGTFVHAGQDAGLPAGIAGADVPCAPSFGQVAGRLAALLAGRVLVGHDVRALLAFLQREYVLLGYDVPLAWPASLCTKALGAALHPGTPAGLAEACRLHGVPLGESSPALAGARATAGLLRRYQAGGASLRWWSDAVELASAAVWPTIPRWPDVPAALAATARADSA